MTFLDVSGTEAEEKLLWLHVLRRAVFDYVLYKGSGKHKIRWQRAAAYIFEDMRLDGEGLTFSEVCGLFGWEPAYLQRKTKTLDRAQVKKIETSGFRDDLDDSCVEIVNRVLRWSAADAVVPFLAPFHYASAYRDAMTPRVVERALRKRHVSFVPLAVFGPPVA